jgi:hypothetical protein
MFCIPWNDALLPASTTADTLIPHLKRCGYSDALIEKSFQVDRITIPVAAFAGRPFDSWSACIAAVNLNGDSRASAAKVQTLGASTVFVCGSHGVDWWAMGSTGPTKNRSISWPNVANVFRDHKDELAPSRIYNAKLQRPGNKSSQLWFFDVGLMPAIERTRGDTLLRLVVKVIAELHAKLGMRLDSRQAQEDAYRTVFWLLAAKVLHDKNVDNFRRIDLMNVDEVFDRIGKHHGETNRFPPFGKEGRPAINEAAATIATCGSLADVSSESISYVYENALVDKSTGGKKSKNGEQSFDIRKELGIHSTPSVLIHHMLSKMWGMIEEIKLEDRNVFEPACGHAPFLTGAMRWLRDWKQAEQPAATHDYLRSHLHGLEADGFAIELAKLALTLADEPYGNSWQLTQKDMFLPAVLSKQTKKAHLLLSNPPYEAFTQAQRARYASAGEAVTANTKATEMLLRSLPHLPAGGVFGVVVPQGLLYQAEARDLRKFLVNECELSEIALFADNLFEKGDAETAILLGRRRKPSRANPEISYKRVRESDMQSFKSLSAFSSDRVVDQHRFVETNNYDMRVPDLEEVWRYLDSYDKLETIASVGQGLIHHSKDLPGGAWTVKPYSDRLGKPGFAQARHHNIYELPAKVSINLDPKVIRRPMSGTTVGVPQVLLNYHPVAREPWRLKAVIDQEGHAVTSSFLAIRPYNSSTSLAYLWSLLNSPVANAYAYCFLQKRNILAGSVRLLPVPKVRIIDMELIVNAAHSYCTLAQQRSLTQTSMTPDLFADKALCPKDGPDEAAVRLALLQLDATILKLYDLPPRLERQLLDLFSGVDRKGVGCTFPGYYPNGLTAYLPLYMIIDDRYKLAAADETAARFKPGESLYVRDVLRTAAGIEE